jgi:site-specific DNA-cytosine methylase
MNTADVLGTNVQGIFNHMVERFLNKTENPSVFQRELRIATMCSGTESPLLALAHVSSAVEASHSVRLSVKHVFSCEIEPFKQAYIERNFHPPLLFRDVRELGRDFATTVYGALVAVPGNVDILVAGTSCVDFSCLNGEKKGLEEQGESGETFRGMMRWVSRHKPAVVLLENVVSAPWEQVAKKFRLEGYACEFVRLDTKNYYVPHTRNRVYLFAVLSEQNSNIPTQWKTLVKSLECSALGGLESFLFSDDDTALAEGRKMYATKRPAPQMDWARCEARHKKARHDEGLGIGTPMTHWPTGCALPDFAWNKWAANQSNRVLDLMDIFYLRSYAKDDDP